MTDNLSPDFPQCNMTSQSTRNHGKCRVIFYSSPGKIIYITLQGLRFCNKRLEHDKKVLKMV